MESCRRHAPASFPGCRGAIDLHFAPRRDERPTTHSYRPPCIDCYSWPRSGATLPRRYMSPALPSATAFAWANDCTTQRGDCSGSRSPAPMHSKSRRARIIMPAKWHDVQASRSKPNSRELSDPREQLNSIYSQCIVDSPGVPSDHVPTKTIKTVTRSSGSFAAITGEPGRLAPQLFPA
jgi:hypothetical protein